jgi:REP element-mobilizing transposase RayT
MKTTTFYKTYNLAHLQPVGATFFITFRLYDSIPVTHFIKIKEERDERIDLLKKMKPKGYLEEIQKERKRYFKKYDEVLDKTIDGPQFLKNPVVAKIVIDKLKQYDGKLYELIAYCVMSNHVHIVINTGQQIDKDDLETYVETGEYVELKKIMQLIKGGSAIEANKLLGRTGKHFWHRDYFDYFARNGKELLRIISYVVENPVKAKLVKDWKEWPYSYWKNEV